LESPAYAILGWRRVERNSVYQQVFELKKMYFGAARNMKSIIIPLKNGMGIGKLH